MSKAQTTRAYGGPLKVKDVIHFLEQCGWESRQGAGDHITMHKPGQPMITLHERLSRNTMSSVQRVVGMELNTLTTRKKGTPVTEAEWRKRLALGRRMYNAGFSQFFIFKHLALHNIHEKMGLTIELYDAYSDDEIYDKYVKTYTEQFPVRRGRQPVSTTTFQDPRKPGPVVVTTPGAGRATGPEPAPVPVLPQTKPTNGDIEVVWEAVVDLKTSIETLTTGRGERAQAYAERLRVIARQLEQLRQEQAALTRRTEDILETLREFR